MSGQPQALPWISFDVTGLSVTELPPSIAPASIIPRDGSFVLSAAFNIDGIFGKGFNDMPPALGPPQYEYNVTYYAESMGPAGPDYKFPPGPATTTHAIPCVRGQYSYAAPQTSYTVPANTMDEGTYKLTCVVKMSPIGSGSQGFPLHVVGFVEGPMIDIYIP
jgi:hypothetical protein